MAAGPPPAWVLARTREYIADGLKTAAIAAQLSHNGYPCTWRLQAGKVAKAIGCGQT